MFRRLAHILILATMLAGLFALNPANSARAASIIVNSNADTTSNDGICTLREAINNANSNAATHPDCTAGSGADTITFAGNYTITLSSQLPTITSVITITGAGAANTIIQANASPNTATYRILAVNAVTGNLTLNDLTIRHGKCAGSCSVSGNDGGGILNNGILTITNSIISGNTSSKGGGISNTNSLTITNSTISNNSSSGLGGGGINNDSLATLTITDSTISDNTSTGGGGGIRNLNNLSITNSTISGNSVSGTGGGILNLGTLDFINSTLANNSSTADNAGGIYNGFSLTITGSEISGNTAFNDGGGIYNVNGASLTVTSSTLSGNTANNNGGGMINYFSTITIINSTFSGNTANNYGGGINNPDGTTTVTNSTFSGNSAAADSGGAISNGDILNMSNTILANSITGGDCIGSIASGTNNLIEDASNACGLTNGSDGNIIGSDPNLGSLTGSPVYFPLNTGSPAINTGSNVICAAAPVNNQSQNGVTRPQGGTCDIGAVEVLVPLSSSTFKSTAVNDGWILESSETSNTGGTLNSAQTTITLGDDAADKQYRAILHFDTSALPDTAVVTNMTLKIKQQGSVTGTSPFTFGSLYVDMRNPAFGTSALELTDFNFAAKKVKPAVFNPNPVSGWFSARFNTGGKLYINRTGVSQLRLYFSVDDNNNNIADFIRFFSGNAAAGDRPKLLITYYVP